MCVQVFHLIALWSDIAKHLSSVRLPLDHSQRNYARPLIELNQLRTAPYARRPGAACSTLFEYLGAVFTIMIRLTI